MAGASNPLTEKCLINISYCPHQSLGDFFLDELNAEVSNAFSATDKILLLGDYNIDMLSVNGKKSLQNFAAGLGLQLSKIDIPTRISNNKRSLIDHCFSTNEQITSWKVCLPPFDIDHNVVFDFEKQSGITDKEYKQAIDCWKNTGCETIKDYMMLYLRTDVLLSVDVFERLRDKC